MLLAPCTSSAACLPCGLRPADSTLYCCWAGAPASHPAALYAGVEPRGLWASLLYTKAPRLPSNSNAVRPSADSLQDWPKLLEPAGGQDVGVKLTTPSAAACKCCRVHTAHVQPSPVSVVLCMQGAGAGHTLTCRHWQLQGMERLPESLPAVDSRTSATRLRPRCCLVRSVCPAGEEGLTVS